MQLRPSALIAIMQSANSKVFAKKVFVINSTTSIIQDHDC